jgi:hypothetical protein
MVSREAAKRMEPVAWLRVKQQDMAEPRRAERSFGINRRDAGGGDRTVRLVPPLFLRPFRAI